MSRPGLIRSFTALGVCALAGCSNIPPGGGGLHVVVEIESGVRSQCVVVTATDGVTSRTTDKMPIDGQAKLDVAIVANGMGEPVTVQALGFLDVDCKTATPGEMSEPAEGRFGVPPKQVTLKLSPVAALDQDGGTDAGVDAGMDGGFDAGLDLDHDGSPQPQDCDDTNPDVRPGMTESCTNRIDDDCDQLTDCEDMAACAGSACAMGGTCVGTTCMTPTEQLCDDRADNDNDQLIDCADPDCGAGTSCNDGNSCTTGDRCVTDGGCEATGSFACMSPPNLKCWAMAGTCEPDGGPTCTYATRTGSCDDDDACTTGETCSNGTCGGGTAVSCGTPPVCRGAGTCQPADGGCVFPPLTQGTGCTDGNNCTINDTCDGDGGCLGTPVVCTAPTDCHQVNTGMCEADGGCTYTPRTGQSCDAGAGQPLGSCNSSFTCVPQSSLFPFTPSNFTDTQLPDAGTSLTVSCDATIDTSNTPSITSNCGLVLPAYTIITQQFGGQAVLFRVTDLNVDGLRTLTIIGSRPAIVAATGNINIAGTSKVIVRNGAGSGDCGTGSSGNGDGNGSGLGGGGGGGFGNAGGRGGHSGGAGGGQAGAANGNNTLTPLRGGCAGGSGRSAPNDNGGSGGGALQLVSANALTVSGTITAPGRGGQGGATGGGGGGGGGSGGGILLEANTVSLGGTVTANGGGGGEGNGNNAGGDGTELSTGALGGFGAGSGAGNGGLGGAAATTPGNGEDVGNNNGGGGGGGGVGRIRIYSRNGCSVTGTVSPQPSRGGSC
ncbi:MAG: MopE-related protein [Myxococcota bacterium]